MLGIWKVVFFPVPEEIVYSFSVHYFLDKRVWFIIIFLLLSSRYGFFAIPSLILSHLELSRIELPKLTSSILMEILQRLDFLKSLSLSQMHLHIVLKSRKYSIKAGNISQEDGGAVSKIYHFNLKVSYLYSFNPFIGINETGKYLNRNNV